MCYKDSDAKGDDMENCQMFVKSQIEPRDINLFKLSTDKSANSEVPQESLKAGDFIENQNIKLQFNSGNAKDSSLNFSILDKVFNTENAFEFLMRYWPSYCNNYDGNGHNSGAYDFRPIDNLFETLSYSELTDAKIQKGSFMSKMTFYFEKVDKKTKEMGMKAIVHIIVDQDLDVIKFDLDLNSLPTMYTKGYEFVATFDALDFNNNQTFFTDSNGLEMQKRILNYRPTWDLQANYNQSNENITANYYPVQSAISMKDGSRVFTVMNDRSQGGSALSDGTIEFM